MTLPRLLATVALSSSLLTLDAQAQTRFGTGCAGASGVTPQIAMTGAVVAGQFWTLEIRATGGLGLGYLLIGFSNTSASLFGGAALPLDLAALFADPLWTGCSLLVDPSYAIQPYLFDPNTNGGLASFVLPGFGAGTVFLQAINLDPDFSTRIAGVSQGLRVRPRAPVPTLVPIAAGTFQMGSNAPTAQPYLGMPSEKPVHTVTISQPFWIGEYEVTQLEYEALVGTNPSAYLGPQKPVDKLTWFDAVAYCDALTAQESALGNVPAGYEFRLPTEAEWEYACRAGTTTEFGVGNGTDLFCTNAGMLFSNHSNTNCFNPSGQEDVRSYPPNAWGLYDMHGNVAEWCLDTFAPYTAGSVTDPIATGGPFNVLRGGSWSSYSSGCRSAHRASFFPFLAGQGAGLRVVLGPIVTP
jgi:formylglycine-generating enzyme required for sulfatase activity